MNRDKENRNALAELWQGQPLSPVEVDMKAIRRQTNRLTSAVKLRNLSEYAAAVFCGPCHTRSPVRRRQRWHPSRRAAGEYGLDRRQRLLDRDCPQKRDVPKIWGTCTQTAPSSSRATVEALKTRPRSSLEHGAGYRCSHSVFWRPTWVNT